MSNERVIKIGDSKKYGGKYIALKDFGSQRVVAFGKDPSKVAKRAEKKGYPEAVIVYIPKPGEIFIYTAVA